MKFLDADVKKPLGAVSAIVDQGNTVVFSRRHSYIQNDTTGETIPVVRSGGTYVIEVEVPDAGAATRKKDRKVRFMEVNGEEEVESEADDEGGSNSSSSSAERTSVFHRQER